MAGVAAQCLLNSDRILSGGPGIDSWSCRNFFYPNPFIDLICDIIYILNRNN